MGKKPAVFADCGRRRIDAGHPLGKKRNRPALPQALKVLIQLILNQGDRIPFKRGIQKDKKVIPSSVFRNMDEILPEFLREGFGQEPEKLPSRAALSEAAADIAEVKGKLQRKLAVFRKGAVKKTAQCGFTAGTHGSAHSEQVEQKAAGGILRIRAVFRQGLSLFLHEVFGKCHSALLFS